MFNLETAIASWRRQMQTAGLQTPAHLDELESHLREEIEMRLRSGAALEPAFNQAVQMIGRPAQVQPEFAKIRAPKVVWRIWLKGAFLRAISFSSRMPEGFTPGTQEVLATGRREAEGFQHNFIGTEHVLLGLFATPAGVVPTVLQKMGVDHQIVRREIEKLIGPGPVPPFGHHLARTPRLKRALRLAGAEARRQRQNQICPEHVFLGLLREGGGVAAMVLKTLGLDIQIARAEIARELGRSQIGA